MIRSSSESPLLASQGVNSTKVTDNHKEDVNIDTLSGGSYFELNDQNLDLNFGANSSNENLDFFELTKNQFFIDSSNHEY